MELLNLQTIFFNCFIELLFKVLDHSFLLSELLVFIVDDSLQSFDGLLSSLGNSGIFLLVISLDFLLSIKESPGIIFKLTAGQFCLHDK